MQGVRGEGLRLPGGPAAEQQLRPVLRHRGHRQDRLPQRVDAGQHQRRLVICNAFYDP